MSPARSREARPVILTVDLVLIAIAQILGLVGGPFVLMGVRMAAKTTGMDIPATVVPEVIVGMTISALTLIAVPFVWKGIRWAWVTLLILLGLSLLMGVRNSIVGDFDGTRALLIAVDLVFAGLLLTPPAREFCSR